MEVHSDQESMGILDWLIFAGVLLLSAIIGVYFAWKERGRSSTVEYYFGGRKMHPIAVGMSVAVTGISAITVVGIPAEVYVVGTSFAWGAPAIFLAALLSIVYIIPVFCRLRLQTIYEYLEMRFSSTARRLCSLLITLQLISYMAITVYLPALSLNAVSSLPVSWSIVLTSAICTFYTTLGGMKAVVWTDVIQAAVMIIGTLAVLLRGIAVLGGFGEVSEALTRGQRNTALSMTDFDIYSRVFPPATWSGAFFLFVYNTAFSQPAMQRFQACKNTRQARYSLISFIVTANAIILVSICCGFVMYAYFEGCDPVESGKIKKLDQGMPFLALTLLHDYPGLTGLFVAAVYSGCLSTVSSGINALSGLIVEDWVSIRWPDIKEKTKLLLGKLTALCLGILVMIISFAISLTKSNILKLFSKLGGVVIGPEIGMFVLGLFFPWCNSWGAISGATAGFGCMTWMLLGSMSTTPIVPRAPLPPVSIDKCFQNITNLNERFEETTFSPLEINATASTLDVQYEGASFGRMVYSISFHYYIFVGIVITVFAGLVVSFISGPNSPATLDPRLFVPVLDNPILPIKVQKFFRFGVPELASVPTISEDTKKATDEL